MGIQVAAVVTPPPCSSPSSSSPASPSSSAIAASPRHAVPGVRLGRSQSSLAAWSAGLGSRRRGGPPAIRRALSASIDSVGSDGGDDEEFLRRIQELTTGQHPGAGGCGWPASVERSASSVGLPLSLRMLKRRKQQQQQLEQGRWDERLMDRAGESARAAVGRAFASMVLIIRELQSFTLQMREALFYEDLQVVLARVHAEMHASFVWLFQHIFSGTPALMVSLMLLLANFTAYSMGDSIATAATLPPSQAAVAAVEMVDTQQPAEQSYSQQRFDPAALKTFSSTGRTASVGGNGDGGGKVRPVAGATGDGQSDESSRRRSGAVLPQDASQQATPLSAGSEASVSDSMAVEEAHPVQDELAIWKRISDEATRMQASVSAEELMDPEILEQLVAPVEAPAPDAEYSAEHAATAQRYEQAVSEEPNNSLLLANFAQFLYQVQGDHDRAEHFFKRAVRAEPADAEALGRYAAFLWQARNDLAAAEETYQEAIAADPSNAHHAAAYAHFLWNTGGEDTCYPLD
ncbi:hypothetical protein PAHAL_5G084900 [Panicum hallii]|uniref:Uncharacterized protein n=1 Tax=Panicum hallii TaxID=206008 RepID=A0A2S3HPW0_9POAL|nr:uncharacterized protein LOC112893656 [Panicum hallii]PAN27500.1 hypothetical protein PAHAL_5G084900 [Panicum hallii]PAN27501.1 hypothetical protein PAHAL_5G084900 [Panicum hallii]